MLEWLGALLAPVRKAPPVEIKEDAPAEQPIYLGSREHMALLDQTTERLQNAPINMQFGEDLRATTKNLRSMDEWIARVAHLEWEYGMRTPPGLKRQARADAILAVVRFRKAVRNTVTQHQARPARIFRHSRARSLA